MYNSETKSFNFDPKKAIETILYIAQSITDKYLLLKILYIADKLHLSKYGRLINGDDYARLDYGIVPSNSYDLLKSTDIINDIKVGKTIVSPLRKPNLGLLSKSDIKCLDKSIEENKGLSFSELKKKTHEEDEVYNAPKSKWVTIEELLIKFENKEKVLKHLETIGS